MAKDTAWSDTTIIELKGKCHLLRPTCAWLLPFAAVDDKPVPASHPQYPWLIMNISVWPSLSSIWKRGKAECLFLLLDSNPLSEEVVHEELEASLTK